MKAIHGREFVLGMKLAGGSNQTFSDCRKKRVAVAKVK